MIDNVNAEIWDLILALTQTSRFSEIIDFIKDLIKSCVLYRGLDLVMGEELRVVLVVDKMMV